MAHETFLAFYYLGFGFVVFLGWACVIDAAAQTTAAKGSTTSAADVIDQGPTWRFPFRAQGRDGGELRISRADLEQAGWSIGVPTPVIDRLRQQGAPPTP